VAKTKVNMTVSKVSSPVNIIIVAY